MLFRSMIQGCQRCTGSCERIAPPPAPSYSIPAECRPLCDSEGTPTDERGYCTSCTIDLAGAQVSRLHPSIHDQLFETLTCKGPVRANALIAVSVEANVDISGGSAGNGCDASLLDTRLEIADGSLKGPTKVRWARNDPHARGRTYGMNPTLRGDISHRAGQRPSVSLVAENCEQWHCDLATSNAVCRITSGRMTLSE